jgi:broad specificity phosphatase PhoE
VEEAERAILHTASNQSAGLTTSALTPCLSLPCPALVRSWSLSMLRVTFLRHAESEFNADPTSTMVDCGLTEEGQRQAAALTGEYDVVWWSPLLRAQQTLACSQLTYDCALSRVCFGVREQCVDPCDFLSGEEMTVTESDDQLAERVDAWLDELRQEKFALSTRLLIVSHCEFIHAVTGEAPQNACFVSIDVPVGSVRR